MRIGIDARFYGPKGKGLGRYTERLIQYLEKHDTDNQYFVFLRADSFEEYAPQNPNFKKVLAEIPWYGIIEQIKLPFLLYRHKLDLAHFPHFNIPILYFRPFVVTIHDLILLEFPTRRASTLGPIRYFVKNSAYKIIIRSALKRARKIITVSQYTKNQIAKTFNVPPEKIAVVYEACDSVERGQLKLPETELSRLGIKKPYLLYVGNAYPHKNLEGLIEGFKHFLQNYSKKYQLVLIGKEDYFYQRLQNYAARLKIKDRLNFTGFVPQPALADLYRNASLYIIPSFIEGFGLTPLEAMRYGLAVISSNTAALPEILGEAALYFNPKNPEEIAVAADKILSNPELKQELVQRGKKQIEKYSWHNLATETIKIYKAVEADKR